MRNLFIAAALSFSALFLATTGTACNPNFCADHVDNDCRAPLIEEPSGCVDSADCSDSQGASVCKVDTGTCVQCTTEDKTACGGKTPECGVATNLCQACTLHSSCASDACLPDGSCSDEAKVAYVLPASAGGTVNASCTKAAPCSTVAAAVVTKRPFVRISGELVESIELNNVDVSLLGDATAKLRAPAMTPAIEIKGKSHVELQDLEIQGGLGSQGNALLLNGNAEATVKVVRCSLTGSGGTGIRGTTGRLSVYQSRVIRNANGGISLSGSSFDISNNVIAKNGSQTTSLGGAIFGEIETTGNRFEFNTVADNGASRNSTPGVNCASGTQEIQFANNIVYDNVASGAFSQISGVNCTPVYSNIGPTRQGDSTNIAEDPHFVNATLDDYHLTPGSPARDAADPAAKQETDIDRQRRADRRDIGADELMN